MRRHSNPFRMACDESAVITDCVICLEPLSSSRVSTLACGHEIHESCWLKMSVTQNKNDVNRCPICRQDSPVRIEGSCKKSLVDVVFHQSKLINSLKLELQESKDSVLAYQLMHGANFHQMTLFSFANQ